MFDSKKSRLKASRAGFSLIELVVVVTIISIVTSIGVVSYSNFRRGNEVLAAVKTLTATFASARQSAITFNARYQVVIGIKDSTFWTDELGADGLVTRAKVTIPGALPDFMKIKSVTVEGVAAAGDYASIGFEPEGRSQNAVIELIRFDGDSPEQTTTIKVYGPTGVTDIILAEKGI